jgi:hypothetical protein
MSNPATKGEPSAYARANQRARKLEKTKKRVKKLNVCGATTRGGNKCKKLAGWGTSHKGIGKCSLHGGLSPTHVKHAAKKMAADFLGTPMEINPLDAILWCIKIRAGEVRWLGERMQELDKGSWEEQTIVGKQFHLYARERQAALRDLSKFSQMAISLGIAERAVKLAETYGELIAQYTKGLLEDLWPHLDAEGRAKAPLYVRTHLLALDGGMQQDRDLPELTTGKEAA